MGTLGGSLRGEGPVVNSPRSELQILHRGIRERWDIPPDVLEAVPARMREIVESGSPRDAIAAAKVLLAMQDRSQKTSPKSCRDEYPPEQLTKMSFEERGKLVNQRIDRLQRLGYQG